MVSAVFHGTPSSPSKDNSSGNEETNTSSAERSHTAANDSVHLTKEGSMSTSAVENMTDTAAAKVAVSHDWRGFWLKVLPPMAGFGLLLVIWQIVSEATKGSIPSPLVTGAEAINLFKDPFYDNGPNDQGLGWNILHSLERVGIGFGLAALVGIPAGFMIGRFKFLSNMFNPLISLLRPVSPLAWLPIGLLVFKGAHPAAIWTIFICSIWPMLINTAVGVQRVPQDYMNVARVLNLGELKIIRSILFPAVLPYVLTGVRLAVGTAWLVIVAAEMLTGGAGIGFWVWDEWNNLNVSHIIIAIFVIGIVGLILENLLVRLAYAFSFEDVKG